MPAKPWIGFLWRFTHRRFLEVRGHSSEEAAVTLGCYSRFPAPGRPSLKWASSSLLRWIGQKSGDPFPAEMNFCLRIEGKWLWAPEPATRSLVHFLLIWMNGQVTSLLLLWWYQNSCKKRRVSVLVLYCHLKTHPRTSWFIVITILTVWLVVGDFGRCQLARSFLILNCIVWALGTGESALKMASLLFSSVQSLSRVWLFRTPWTAARQASLSITNSRSLLKLMHVHWVGNAIRPSHPLSSPSPLTFNLSQHQGLF